jgi:hypothetical protein
MFINFIFSTFQRTMAFRRSVPLRQKWPTCRRAISEISDPIYPSWTSDTRIRISLSVHVGWRRFKAENRTPPIDFPTVRYETVTPLPTSSHGFGVKKYESKRNQKLPTARSGNNSSMAHQAFLKFHCLVYTFIRTISKKFRHISTTFDSFHHTLGGIVFCISTEVHMAAAEKNSVLLIEMFSNK